MAAPATHAGRRGRRSRLALDLLLLASLALLAAGFLGTFAAPLDSAAHFRAHLSPVLAGLALVAFFQRRRAVAAASAFASIAALATTLGSLLPAPAAPAPDGAVYSLLQMNLRWNATDRIEAVRRIAEASPDIVTLQEMTPDWREALAPLSEAYPYQVHCPGADGFRGDSALLSRRPFAPGSGPVCDERNSLAAARIDLNGVMVTVVSHHQLWPWPAGQWRRLERVRPLLSGLEAPVLLAGDFNAVPWSAFVRRYAETLDARVLPGIGPVWAPPFVPDLLRRTLGLPLNNLIASAPIEAVSIERLPSTTSDHLPVLLRFTVSVPSGAPAVEIAGR